jgi:hypothetical protein
MTKSLQGASDHAPSPSPALERLNRLVGTWKMNGRPVGAKEDTIFGTTTFKWLHDAEGSSFFLKQDMEMDYDGTLIKSLELIGYDPNTSAFVSQVYSNMAPDPWPYTWDIQGDSITIAIKRGAMNATFTGQFSSDNQSFSGGWRPSPGADETINAPYDVVASRIDRQRSG